MAKAATKEMQRLDKCVSHMTGMSRQEASKAIKAGLVLVDGEIITLPTSKVSINSQLRILNDTEDVLEAQFADEGSLDEAGAGSIEGSMSVADAFKKRVYMLNKPDGFVCAARDKNHAVAISLLRSELHSDRLQCVGRLDIDTTGLLLVTDDGALNHELTSPKKQVVKVYIAMLDKAVPEKQWSSLPLVLNTQKRLSATKEPSSPSWKIVWLLAWCCTMPIVRLRLVSTCQ